MTPSVERDDGDETLVARVRAAPRDEVAAFEELVVRHQGTVLANCRSIAGPSEAEDLAQEVFVKAFFRLESFEGRSSFRTWLYRVKVNHCLHALEKRKRRGESVDVQDPAVQEAELTVEPEVDRRLKRRDDQQQILAVLDVMPETLRVPLVLRDLDGLSYEDIAVELKLGLSAVKMRIKRAREQFRELFQQLEQVTDGE